MNICCMSVTLDVSKLSVWLNAYARCRAERRACDARRGKAREALGAWWRLGGGHAIGVHTGRARLKAGGGRARAERTVNMRSILVTLDVSQLDMSALKSCKL